MGTTPRDPYLPPPAVVDWLLEQKWSERISSIDMLFPGNGPFGRSRSELNGYHAADTAIGRDETARLFMPDDALDALREDQDNRQAALDEKRQACDLPSEALAWLQHASSAGCGDLVLQHLLQRMMRLQELEALEEQRACEAGS
jgi:hypothetical protein